MKSFLFFYSLYRKYSAGFVARKVYTECRGGLEGSLWTSKVLFVGFFSLFLIGNFEDQDANFLGCICSVTLWLLIFTKAKNEFFHKKLSESVMGASRLYEKNHQYVRYIFFSENLDKMSKDKHVDIAIRHVENHFDTQSSFKLIEYKPLLLLGTLFVTLLGSWTGKWNEKQLGLALILVMFSAVAVTIFAGLFRTTSEELIELKRFLKWRKLELEEREINSAEVTGNQ